MFSGILKAQALEFHRHCRQVCKFAVTRFILQINRIITFCVTPIPLNVERTITNFEKSFNRRLILCQRELSPLIKL
jgi:hypothetical protein